MPLRINNKKSLKQIRKQLRNNPTETEDLLWEYLKNKKLGEKFRRQHSFGNFILDFYCPNKNLCIELDGAPHFTEEGKNMDINRDAILKDCGIRVLRFANSIVEQDIQSVLDAIKQDLL
jgi:very-short-patch-repair endonuclease